LKPWEYEELTFYDLMLYIEKFNKQSETIESQFENGWNQTRILWAAIRNVMRGKNDTIIEPTDLIKLSFDKTDQSEIKEEKIGFKEAKARLGSKIKKDSGGKQ